MSTNTDEIKPEDVHNLLEHFVKTSHKVKDGDFQGEFIMERCLLLLAKDYHYSVITNFNGELCSHYPSKIVFLEYQKTEADRQSKHQQDVQSMYDTAKLRDLIKQAKYARCRSRFVIPVILCEGKHVCRSATLSGGPELYGRQGFDFFFSGAPGRDAASAGGSGSKGETQMFDRIRGQDIKLLKEFSIQYICDLMVEKKKVKFYVNITSSEKVDKENRYNDFNILTMPYPGCEFFKEWKDNSYLGERMTFDWSQNYVDAELDLPEDRILKKVRIDWKKYRDWDLIHLTKNYMKLLLQILRGGDSGLLIHCISGWDRTPLFISLLRLSLWADGLVHNSLSATEILYLTLAYDWYLFGHNLADRVNNGEEILFFCFNFLTNISGEEFSIKTNKEGRFSSRADSESNIEGVLLDADNRRNSYRGSNNSISSLDSSIVDHPVAFSTYPSEDDAFLPHGCTNGHQSQPSHPSVSQSPRHSLDGNIQINHFASTSSSSSSPVAVPPHSRRAAMETAARASSPACGSWQVISSSGSLRGYVTSSESPLSLGSDSSSGRLSSCQEAVEAPETARWKRLDAVRKIFHSAYASKIFSRGAREGGGIGNLLDQFAEKVGIRNRNTFV